MNYIENVGYAGDYSLRFSLQGGKTKVIDFSQDLWGDVFEPLKDKALFQQAKFLPEIGTVVWPTGADIAPEELKNMLLA